MIDFKINDIGDIVINEQEKIPTLNLTFSRTKKYNNLKINFKTKTRHYWNKAQSGLKINFEIRNIEEEKTSKVQTVNAKEEYSQSIAIRLKTELNELQNFFYDFGSELNKMRHKDLNAPENIERIKDYVEYAIRDIVRDTPVKVLVEKSDEDDGNFKLETLKIIISDMDDQIIYTYTI